MEIVYNGPHLGFGWTNPFALNFDHVNFDHVSNKLINCSTKMLKTASTTEHVADKLAAITTAAEALFKHTTKAISLRDKVNRTTWRMGSCVCLEGPPLTISTLQPQALQLYFNFMI